MSARYPYPQARTRVLRSRRPAYQNSSQVAKPAVPPAHPNHVHIALASVCSRWHRSRNADTSRRARASGALIRP